MGWLIAYALLGAFFIWVVLQFPAVKAAACLPGEVHCFREWVSALGGWAAVIVAVPTVYFLSAQIRSATAHQKVTYAMNVRANLALSYAVKKACGEVDLAYTNFQKSVATVKGDEARLQKLKTQYGIMKEILSRPHFADFEVKIGTASARFNCSTVVVTLGHFIAQIENHQKKLDTREKEESAERLVESGFILLTRVHEYAAHVSLAADDYLGDVEMNAGKLG